MHQSPLHLKRCNEAQEQWLLSVGLCLLLRQHPTDKLLLCTAMLNDFMHTAALHVQPSSAPSGRCSLSVRLSPSGYAHTCVQAAALQTQGLITYTDVIGAQPCKENGKLQPAVCRALLVLCGLVSSPL